MEELLKKISGLIKNAPKILQTLAFQYNFLAQQFIQAEMNADKSTKEGEFNKTNKLNVNSGTNGLAFSFDKDGKQTQTEFKINNKGLTGTIGSKLPYAEIHEKGGFIKSKGKMHKYFWAKYYETNKDFYKFIALSVLNKGGVNIKARPYFAPAMKELREKGQQIIEDYFREEVENLYARQ